ncbi:MAG: peptidase M13, partial [Actinobacteria bacterium]|nr:peptidase M13 [Actinomycetota bacterium]
QNPQPGVSQQIGDMYGSFLDEARANELGAAPIAVELRRIDEASFGDLTHIMGELERGGCSGLFGFYVNNDPGNPERYLVNMYHGGLGLPDESYYHDEKYAAFRDAYVPYISKMLELSGWSAADADADAKKILAFETALSKHHWNVVDSRDAEKTYNLRSFDELNEMMPTFDWAAYLNGMK